MAVLFPFEKKIYDKENIPCSFVGHPLTKKVKSDLTQAKAREKLGLKPNIKTIGLLPGSRKQEIDKILPTLIASANLLSKQQPELQFVMPKASSLTTEFLQQQLPKTIQLIDDNIYDVLRACDAVVAMSGTVTLEVALMQVPLTIVYKMSPLSFWLANRLVRIPYAGLCNIVAEQCIAKELLQKDATPRAIAAEVLQLLDNTEYRQQRLDQLAALDKQLQQTSVVEQVDAVAFRTIG